MKYLEIISEIYFNLSLWYSNLFGPLLDQTGVFTIGASKQIAIFLGYIAAAISLFVIISTIFRFLHKLISEVSDVLFIQSTSWIKRTVVNTIKRVFQTIGYIFNSLFGWIFRFGKK